MRLQLQALAVFADEVFVRLGQVGDRRVRGVPEELLLPSRNEMDARLQASAMGMPNRKFP
jgi:hypothetical protein